MTALSPCSLKIGCFPVLRSMMLSLLWPSRTPLEPYVPASSGPRWERQDIILCRSALSSIPAMPQMPHILAPLREAPSDMDERERIGQDEDIEERSEDNLFWNIKQLEEGDGRPFLQPDAVKGYGDEGDHGGCCGDEHHLQIRDRHLEEGENEVENPAGKEPFHQGKQEGNEQPFFFLLEDSHRG